MPTSFIRLISLLATITLSSTLAAATFFSVTFALAMSHYILAFYHSRRQPAPVTIAIGAVSLANVIPWMWLGLGHFLLGDIMVVQRGLPRITPARIALNVAAFLILFRIEPVIGLALLLGGAFFYRPQSLDQFAYDLLTLAIVIYSFWRPFTFLDASLAHFIFWGILQIPARGRAKYFASTFGLFAGFLCMPPMNELWMFGNSFHTLTSLAILPTYENLFARVTLALRRQPS